MSFWIQASNPTYIQDCKEEASDLSEAIQNTFPMETEAAIIVWNHIYLPLSYKYDLSIMIDDILLMCSNLLNQEEGNQQIFFGSNTFNTQWNLSWRDGFLSVSAIWNSAIGDIDVISSSCNTLEITVDDFLSEWKRPLKQIILALEKSNFFIFESSNYRLMIDIESAIKENGHLYRSAPF